MRRNDVIHNRAEIINDVLGHGGVSRPVSVAYPPRSGRGVFSVCGCPLYDWRVYDLDEVERALERVDAIKSAVWLMSRSGHLYYF